MKYFVDKRKVIHRGQKNSSFTLRYHGPPLTIVAREQDFEVMTDSLSTESKSSPPALRWKYCLSATYCQYALGILSKLFYSVNFEHTLPMEVFISVHAAHSPVLLIPLHLPMNILLILRDLAALKFQFSSVPQTDSYTLHCRNNLIVLFFSEDINI